MEGITPNISAKNFLTRHVTGIDIAASIIILILVMTSVFYALRAQQSAIIIEGIRDQVLQDQVNIQVLEFSKLFIEKVLKAESEIDFETRLKLESSVRALRDDDILASWQAFTGSTTESQAQTAVKDLLSLLIQKIR